MEIHYKLQGYGIPFEHVPISWTGKVKVQYLKQWMRIRLAIEQSHQNTMSSDEESVSSSVSSSDDIIECPQLQDVVFRQGTSGVSHPGNVTFRSLIESTVLTEHYKQQQRDKEEQESPSKSGSSKKAKAKRPKQLALEIYEERQKTSSSTGRFLVWNNDKGWWNKLSDKEHICMKIEYMVREFQKLCQKRSGTFKKKTSTTKKKHPCDEELHQLLPSADAKNIIYLQSGTSLFTSQYGGETAVPFFANKRQRLNNIANTTDDFEFGKSKTECFGMKFTPCLT